MAHHESNEHLTPEQRHFNDCIRRGDDFFRITLFRYARDWYRKALEINPNNESACEKFAQSEASLNAKNKTVYTVLAVIAVLLVVVFITKLL